MTTIVAVEKDGAVTFASDTRVSGYHLNDGWVEKVVRNGPFVFAAAGHLRAIQVMQYAKLPMPPSGDDLDGDAVDRFVTKELVPAMREAFEDSKSEDSNEMTTILGSVSNRVYQFSSDGAWVRSPFGRYAIGSGSDYALGALEAGADPKEAVRIASIYDSGTNSDVHVFEQDEK